jgi:hypothetical protein
MACRVGPAGVEEQGIGTRGFSRNLGVPVASTCHSGRGDRTDELPAPSQRPGSGERKCGRTTWYRQAKDNGAWRKGGQDVGASHSTVEPGELASREPWGGKGTLGDGTVGGKHGRSIEAGNRVHETTTDSGTGEASAADGIHLPGAPHRRAVAARGLRANAAGWGRGRGWTDDPGLQRQPRGQPEAVVGPGEVRHVPRPTGAAGPHSER